MIDEAAFGAQLARAAGAAATYTPPGGVPVSTYAALERAVRERADGVGVERITLAHLPAADVPAPAVGGYVAIGASTYQVDALAGADAATVTVTVRAL